jgi:hypothetical protein
MPVLPVIHGRGAHRCGPQLNPLVDELIHPRRQAAEVIARVTAGTLAALLENIACPDWPTSASGVKLMHGSRAGCRRSACLFLVVTGWA